MGDMATVDNITKMNNDTANRFKLWTKEARKNPHAVYARMREEEPICKLVGPVSGNIMWIFSRYEDAAASLKDPRFIKDFTKLMSSEDIKQYFDSPASAIDRHMLNLDPPDHTRLRTLVSKAFTPRMIANLEPRIQQISDTLITAMLQKDSANLIEDFAFPLPITVIAEMLGVPPEEREQFRVWSRTLLFTFDQVKQTQAAMEIIQYFMGIFAQRRADPREDLISALLSIEEQGDRLSPQELLGMLFLLLVAGHETTVNLIGNGTLALLQHPDQLALLRENPSLITSAVEEMLRYEGPIENALVRFAGESVEWGGCLLEQGAMVYAGLFSANRDPRQFPDPDKFDITREANKHLAFGHGIHYCLGAPLARLEGAIAINALVNRAPNLRLAISPDDLEWNDSFQFRGVKSFPIKL